MSQEALKYRVVDFRKMPSIKPDRRGLEDATISYELQDGTRDTVMIPAESATPEAVKQAIEDAIRFKLQFLAIEGEVPK
jgi:hypothetical protein